MTGVTGLTSHESINTKFNFKLLYPSAGWGTWLNWLAFVCTSKRGQRLCVVPAPISTKFIVFPMDLRVVCCASARCKRYLSRRVDNSKTQLTKGGGLLSKILSILSMISDVNFGMTSRAFRLSMTCWGEEAPRIIVLVLVFLASQARARAVTVQDSSVGGWLPVKWQKSSGSYRILPTLSIPSLSRSVYALLPWPDCLREVWTWAA